MSYPLLLMYGSETCTLYHHQVRKLHTIQQRHLWAIIKVRWDNYIEEVLIRKGVEDTELKLVRIHLRWLGHVS